MRSRVCWLGSTRLPIYFAGVGSGGAASTRGSAHSHLRAISKVRWRLETRSYLASRSGSWLQRALNSPIGYIYPSTDSEFFSSPRTVPDFDTKTTRCAGGGDGPFHSSKKRCRGNVTWLDFSVRGRGVHGFEGSGDDCQHHHFWASLHLSLCGRKSSYTAVLDRATS